MAATPGVDKALYRRLRAHGVPHRAAVAQAAGNPDFAAGGGGGGEAVDLSGYQLAGTAATDSELASAVATLQAAMATDAELAAAIAGLPSGGTAAPSGVSLARTTDFAVTAATSTRIPFETAIREEGGEFWDAGTPTLVTIPASGWYSASASLKYTADPSNSMVTGLVLGAEADPLFATTGATGSTRNIAVTQGSITQDPDWAVSGVFYATAGQKVWLVLYSAAAVTIDGASLTVVALQGAKGDPGPAGGSRLLAHGRYNTTGALVTVSGGSGLAKLDSSEEITFTLTEQTIVELDGKTIYANVSGASTNDLAFQFSKDNWATIYTATSYASERTGFTGAAEPGTRMLQAGKARLIPASGYCALPGPSALLRLEAATWKVRVWKGTMSGLVMAEEAGYFLAKAMAS